MVLVGIGDISPVVVAVVEVICMLQVDLVVVEEEVIILVLGDIMLLQ
tara:strand:- start:225 stop:365 length:141 start_codon:yes stop_codon:yes gene_type:complete